MFNEQHIAGKKDRTEVSVKKEQEKELVITHVGTIVPHRGHKLFEIVDATGEIRKPSYIKSNFYYIPGWKPGDPIDADLDVAVKEGCSYVSALNEKNAIKKWRKGDSGTRIDMKGTFLNISPI